MSRLNFGIIVILSGLYFDVGLGKCPCYDAKLCEPITTQREIEVFAFCGSKYYLWPKYDWTKVTTIVEVGSHSTDLLCYAHSKGVRVVNMIDYGSTTELTNKTARTEWVTTEVNYVRDNYLDGVNVDFEASIHPDQTDLRNGLTMLMQELSEAMKKEFKHSQVTFDLPFMPNGGRAYDYNGIAKACDFILDMAYDMGWNVSGNRAHANSDLVGIQYGVKKYVQQGILVNKIALGLPWYGYNYPCYSYTQGNTCVTEYVPFPGEGCSDVGAFGVVKCNDVGAHQYTYTDIVEKLLPQSTTGLLWDDVSKSPYFTYKDSTTKQLHQVWFDNPKSLSIKYDYATSAGLKGVGMWMADALDYSNTAEGQAQRKEMWGILP